jgi:hypothetical protein
MLPLFTGEDRGEGLLKISGRIPVDAFLVTGYENTKKLFRQYLG